MKILKYFIAFAVMIFFSVFPIEEYYPGLDALVYENIRFFGFSLNEFATSHKDLRLLLFESDFN